MPPPPTPYSNITWGTAKDALLLRLNSTGTDFWTRAEMEPYLAEALRVWNSLTQTYVQDFNSLYVNDGVAWQSLANTINPLLGSNPTSPRLQTLTTTDVFTLIQYHLLEPPTGLTWTGTPQFTIADLAQAFQRTRDYILQQTGCNIGPFSATFSLPPSNQRIYLPDTTAQSILDVLRIRFLPDPTLALPNALLWREDGLAYEYFEQSFTTQALGTVPFAWDVLAGTPLALTFDAPGNVPNTLEMLTIISGGDITPSTPAPLLIPDDWMWVLKFGMMSDMLRKDAESTDLERADYCQKRFEQGVELMKIMPWLLQARINNLPVDTPAVADMDDFDNGWQDNPNAQPAIVRGGIDLFAFSPNPWATGTGFGEGGFGEGGFGGGGVTNISVTLSLVANMPIPTADDQFLQVSRDVLDPILDYAEHVAQFKCGGFEFAESTRTLFKNFIQAAVNTNSRLRESGIFATTLRSPAPKETELQPRFAMAGDK